MAEQQVGKVTLEMVRLSFANNIWKASAVNEGDEPKFNCHFLLGDANDANVKKCKRAIAAVGKQKWGERFDDPGFRKRLKYSFRDQGEKDTYDGYEEGSYFVSAVTSQRPTIRDRDGKTPLIQEDGRPYSGCYVNGIVAFWAQDNKWGKRINCQLVGIQFRQDGDAFSGRGLSASEDDFGDYSEGESGADDDVEEMDFMG